MSKGRILAVIAGTRPQMAHLNLLISEGYQVTEARSSDEAENAVRWGDYGLVLADLSSPAVDSLNFLALYRDKTPLGRIIILSNRPDFRFALHSLKLSANDYLLEPVASDILLNAVEAAFEDYGRAMARFRARVAEENLRLREELERANVETIMALAGALEAWDEYTRGHSFRVAELSVRMGERMSLSAEDLRKLRYGGIVHDIGKISVDRSILSKKTRLTPEDYEEIRQHTEAGARIVSSVESLRSVVPIIRYHHEFYSHLPYVIDEKSRDFMLICIAKVADSYDAMVSERPYRGAIPPEMAVAELRQYAGSEFHPQVVEELAGVQRADLAKDLKRLSVVPLFDKGGLAHGYL